MHNAILETIIARASSLKEEDLDSWILPQTAEYYQSRIDSHGARVYGPQSFNDVARKSFRASSQGVLRNALMTFLFRAEHWKNGRNIDRYLRTCLKRHADHTYWDQTSAKKATLLVCPACREYGAKVFLIAEAKLWRCPNCTSEIDRLEDEVKKAKRPDDINGYKARLGVHKMFALHTRRGFRCPNDKCSRFIPESVNGQFGISCPYSDCDFFGSTEALAKMSHPSALTHRATVSLDAPLMSRDGTSDRCRKIGDFLAHENVSADEKICLNQRFKREYDTLMDVINSQIALVKRMNARGTYKQKLLMYEAFRKMCEQHPEEMVSYLVHLRQSADFPIQARIFQMYVTLTENALPFTLERYGEEVDILSISDPNLGIFKDGISTFDGDVNAKGVISNNTIETYTGNRQFKLHGACFIGKIVDVIDRKTKKSLLNHVKSFSFVQIDMDEKIEPGTHVTVTHFRIPPHYEMWSLVFLQRIRRNIVDKVYFRLNGRKRIVGGDKKAVA